LSLIRAPTLRKVEKVHKEAELRLKHGDDSDYGDDELAGVSYIDDGTSPWAEAEISRVEVALQVPSKWPFGTYPSHRSRVDSGQRFNRGFR